MKWKLKKSNKVSKSILLFFLILIISLEALTFIKKEMKEETEIENTKAAEENISIEEVLMNLTRNNFDIININREPENYTITVKIKGNLNEFNKKVEILEDYQVQSYEINTKDNEFQGIFMLNC